MTVVCSVDSSPTASTVVRYAGDLAARTRARLVLVRAVQVANPLFVTAGVVRALEDPAARRERVLAGARRELAELAAGVDGVETSVELRQGNPVAEVLDTIKEHEGRLLVLGTHARSGLRKALGGEGQRMLRRAPCPVLVVPEGYDRELGERLTVVVGIRGGDRADAATVLREVEKLADLLNAELVLAHSERDGDGAAGDAPWLEQLAGERRHVTVRGRPSRELLRIAAELDADAIAVAPRGHGPLRRALLGSVSSDLLSADERLVFVLPRSHA